MTLIKRCQHHPYTPATALTNPKPNPNPLSHPHPLNKDKDRKGRDASSVPLETIKPATHAMPGLHLQGAL